MADVQRLITAAANEAALKIKTETILDRDGVEKIFEAGLDHFCERLGLPTDREGIDEWRKDLSAMRAARETREALVSHGLKAVLTILAGGAATAIWMAIRGVK